MTLKPFVINLNDLVFLLSQVNFVPLFDAETNGNGIVNFDPLTMDAWDAKGNQVWDWETQEGSYQGTDLTAANVALLGQGFPQVSAPVGVRDVSGLHNNLFGTQADWGAVDVPFRREIAADFTNYVTTAGADYTPGNSVIDYMPRIISRTITTAGVNLLLDGSGHYVNWDSARYLSDIAYAALVDNSGVTIANLVEGAKIVAPVNTEIAILDYNGDPLIWDSINYSTSVAYTTALAFYAANSYGGLMDSTGGTLQAGEQIYYRPAPGAAPTLLPTGPTYQPDVLAYKQLIDANVDFSAGAPADGTAIVTTVSESGYGLLETLGHVDFQQPDNGEFFIGSENPGVAPVNSWFAIFGQFFDHGLDKLGAGGNGKITIALETTDPLYRAPGTNGPTDPGNTKITVTRATIDPASTTDPNSPNYINHTSPFIDQSQTYGSVDQITQILRKWVSTDSGATYHAGMELYDGTTLVDAWTRKWPDGTTTQVHDTLPTLSELRNHVADTGRDELTWNDVSNLRNRDATTGDVSTGLSGHALILDMNPRFDAAHLTSTQDVGALGGDTVASRVTAAVVTLNASIATTITGMPGYAANNPTRVGGSDVFSQNPDGTLNLSLGEALAIQMGPGPATVIPAGNYGGANAMMLWVNFADFSIMAPPATNENAAVGEILMATVGDHYIAGDGRVNENFGLTSIHHVFHEEHNFQVENLKSWIYQHDANNSPVTHDGLHAWQINTSTQDAQGNYIYANGDGTADDVIAWDADKMFEATKLIVEMEYQHAAVDQYARTITPRIQEFVGYSTGVDSTISLEFAQSAFRFGHSTIRETIDTIDPSGWMLGNVTRYALEKAFLNPGEFADEGVAAITLGLARQQMNEVDEFITPALNQGLLGMPLDLAAINIARGRDMGIPTLNDFREGISLARYTSWDDFGKNMVHPESLVNFIAAYSFGGDVAKASAIMGLYDGTLADGDLNALGYTAADALAFMLNNTTVNADLDTARDGFNHIDSWIGGLAEAHVPGGLLGETFDAVFVAQIQSLMDGDRFYYLFRLFGTNLHEEVNNGQFKDIVERNTGLEHLNGSIFAYADKYYDFNRAADGTVDGTGDNLAEHLYHDTLAANPTLGIFSDGGASTAPNGSLITVTGSDFIRPDVTQAYIRDVRPELDPTQVHTVEGTPTSGADSHEVIVATDNRDYIHGRAGDDTLYGEGGDDFIFGDGGVDRLYGGEGHDMIDTGEGPDLADGGGGKDIIYGRGSGAEVGGFDQLVGGLGNDMLIGGEGIDKLSGGSGDDIIYGDGLTNPEMGNTDAFTHGGDGNDYIDTGASGDLLFGEEGDDYMVGGQDQDLMQGGQGDDILRPGAPSQATGTVGGPDEVVGDNGQAGEMGFDLIDLSDWAGSAPGTTIDFFSQQNPLVAIDMNTPFPAWFQIEGAIGTSNGDTFIGSNALDVADNANPFGGSNWLIGGSGSDTFTGNGGNDVIIGGSIRLDTLIGQYVGADNGDLALGSTAWLADAMQTAPGGIGYSNNTEDAYTGASNRALGDIGTGLLDNALLGTDMFDKHFTEMLRSRMFKDVKLGDGLADGTADKALFTGNFADYTITEIVFTPTGSSTPMTAYKVVDNVAGRDGTDIVVGVEFLQFADQTVNSADHAPTGALSIVDYQLRGGARQNSVVRLQAASTIDDADGHANVTNTWQRQNADGTWSNFGVAGSFTLRVIAAGTYRFVETYTDSFGVKTVVSGHVAFVGGAAGQVMAGTAGQDIMLGMGGNDTLNGSAGNDIMDGGAGVDTASFAAMTQSVTVNLGASAPATILTDAGAGTATGAEIGSDYLVSIANVTGGAGDDALTGDNTANVLIGGAGNDTLDSAGGNDTLTGGLGDDTIDGGLNTDTAIYGKSVFSFNFSTTGSLVVADTDVAPATSLGTDTLSNIELLQFTEGTYNLVLGTNAVNNPLNGGAGNDLILGFDGADTLNGNGGADILIGGLGADFMNGGGGNDIYVVDDAGDTITEGAGGGSGTDLVRSSVTRTLEINVENLTLTGLAAIDGGGNDGANTIVGNNAANLLSGAGGNDTLTGGLGNDTLDGGANGTAAGDLAVFGKSAMSFTFGGTSAALTVDDTDGNAATDLGMDTLTTIERLQFAEGTFVLNTAGTGGDDTITTTGANDLILGFEGADILNGGIGADIIDGGIGMDAITGGAGRDIMTGGADDDTFVFATGNSGNTTATRDIVTDFASGDRIDLFGWDANGGVVGDQNFASLFVDDFTVAGELRYYLDVNGNTIIEGNTDADAASEFQIQLNGAFELQHVVSATEDYLILA